MIYCVRPQWHDPWQACFFGAGSAILVIQEGMYGLLV